MARTAARSLVGRIMETKSGDELLNVGLGDPVLVCDKKAPPLQRLKHASMAISAANAFATGGSMARARKAPPPPPPALSNETCLLPEAKLQAQEAVATDSCKTW